MRLLFLILFLACTAHAETITIGSKIFTESYILGEIAAQSLREKTDANVVGRWGIGGTGLLTEALRTRGIDFYPEYTGTIAETILKDPSLTDFDSIQSALKNQRFIMSQPLGFNNSYAIALPEKLAEELGIETLSDLSKFANANTPLHLALSPEFFGRSDGWPRMQAQLHLPTSETPRVISHSLAFSGLAAGGINAIDVYSTDAMIQSLHLRVLRDDLHIFPKYQAVYLAHQEFVERNPRAWEILNSLAGKINEKTMIALNSQADVEKRDYVAIASRWLQFKKSDDSSFRKAMSEMLIKRTREHLTLVLFTVLFSGLVGVPLGFIVHHRPAAGQVIMAFSGLVQTIPALALLCLLIPFFGVGEKSALVALCLYGLLPVVVNTYVGLDSIAPIFRETAYALGLSSWQTLWRIDLPLASRSIWAGLKTSTIITIGTATLAALIGAGGLGAPIVEGLAMNNLSTVVAGAIPAALLALVAHFALDRVEKFVIPRGLRK